jgi:hypothetical protein
MRLWSLTACFLAFFAVCSVQAEEDEIDLPDAAPMPAVRPADAPPRRDAGPRFPVLLPISKEQAEVAEALCKMVLAKEKLHPRHQAQGRE